VTLQYAHLSERVLKSWKKWEAVPENREAFDAVERIWELTEEVPELPAASSQELAADDYDGSMPVSTWLSARAPDSTAASPVRRRLVFQLFGLAAAVAAIAISLQAVPFIQPYIHSLLGTPPDRTVVVETGIGEHKQIVFEDGTHIQLGARTAITANFSKSVRSVALDHGEAHFQVAKDPKRPFQVSAAGGTITAVGTAFNVQRRQDSDVLVLVTEGIVEVAPPPSVNGSDEEESIDGRGSGARPVAQRVARGHEVAYDGQGKMSAVRLAEVDTSLAWRNGRFKYTNEPLKHVIEDINRYSRKQVIFDDEAVGNLMYSGTVFESEVDEWVSGLEKTFPQIEVVTNDDERVRLRSRAVAEETKP
jgi:transmembrane sensor